MQRRRTMWNKDYALLLLALSVLVGREEGIATPKLHVDTTARSEVRFLIDSDFHTRFGLAFPVTYIIGIPRGIAGLTAFTRYDTNAAWVPLPTKTSNDFFNDSQVVRFDTSEGIAYVSASFAPESDFLAIRITDSAGTAIGLSYEGIARYYDNRNAAVLVSIDDWKAMTDSLFRHATTVLRSYDLAITAAIITSDCDASTWQHLQEELDAGSFEAASHTRTHARWPYTDIVSQVQGSRQDILSRLTLPPLYRKGNQEYVYSFLVPFGETSPEIEEGVTQSGYLISRLVGTSNGDFVTWNPQGYRYNADGTTMEMGPPWGSTSSMELNSKFDSTVQAGHIYHLLMHPWTLGQTDEWLQPYVTEHLSHISQRTDIWYATLGQLYVYHLVGDTATEQTSPPEVPLTFTLNPSDVAVIEGESATFQVLAIGNPPLSYQWQKDFVPLAGATDPTLITGPTTASDDGSTFQCVISNTTGSIVSSRAILAVSDSALPVGGNLVVNPGFEEGTEDWTFHTETSGAFHTEVAGYESPRAGTITIGSPASNIQLYQTEFPLVAGKQYRLSFQACSNSGRNLSVTVQRHSSPYTVLGLSLTEFDITSTWQPFSVEFTATGFTETTADTRLRFWFAPYAQTGDQYYIDNVTLEELEAGDRPTITVHPVTQTVRVGERVEFSVSASGPSPLQYQWQRNLVDIPSATNAVHSLSPVTPADSGALFRCVVTDPYGTAASAQAMLHVRPIDPAQTGAVRVVVLGSSTAEGEAARPLSNAWANRYREYLQSINPQSELFNFAIGGFTTFNVMPSGYVPPSPWNTSQYVPVNANNITYGLALQPTLIIVNLPTNDCASYIPVSVQMNNYERIIAEARAHNVPVWITSPQGRNVDQAGRSLLVQLRAATEASYPDRVIDFWTGLADSAGFILPEFNFDGTHLNNAGHAVLYDRVVNTVRWGSSVVQPEILAGPQSETILEGDSVVFTVTLQGTRPFAYRWQRNGVEIAGAIDSIYVLPAVTLSESGATFRAIVRNTAGSDTSEVATLGVSPVIAATITAEPLDTTVLSGQSARFAVAASGTAPLTYRWQRNGVDIAGATDSVYMLAAVTQADSGATFRTIVSNRGGSDTSKAAILRVLPLIPATITAEPLDTTLLAGQSARFAVSASGTAPLTFRWQRDSIDIAGATDSVFVLSAITLADSGAIFRAIVSNAGGADTSRWAVLRVLPVVPAVITNHPVDTTLFTGQSARFAVSASGTAPLSYCWQRDTLDIEGANDSVYVLSPVAQSDSGARFRVIVRNVGGSDTSTAGILRVLPASVAIPATITADPVDTTVIAGQIARFVVSASGTTPLTYQWQKDSIDIAGATDSVCVLSPVALSDSGVTLRAIVGNSSGADTSNAAILRVLPAIPATIIAEPVDTTLFAGQRARFTVSVAGSAPVAYRWQKNELDIAQAADSIYVLPAVSSSDSGATFRVIVSNAGGIDTSTTALLRVLPAVPAVITVDPVDTTVFAGQSVRFAVSAIGTRSLAYRWQRDSIDIPEAADSIYLLPSVTQADSGTTFRVIVSNAGGSDTSAAAVLHVLPVVPATIAADPVDTTLWFGQSARFVVSASGTLPIGYRWQRDSVDIPGANDSVYVLTAVTMADSGASFRAIVSNAGGVDTSKLAILRVRSVVPAVITHHPADTTLFTGQSARFSVSASGTAPLSYRWQRDTLDIEWATDSVYVLSPVAQADSGKTFRVVVSNVGGSDTSNVAVLRVSPAIPVVSATITGHPADTTLFAGQTARFAVSTSGTAPLTYRWQRDSVDIHDATDSIYALTAVALADSGVTFRVIVTNAGGSDTSEAAVLRVVPELLGAVVVQLKVFLQGPFSADTMSTALRVDGLIPLSQPYSTPPWDYPVGDSVAAIPADVVDWVLLELRTGTGPSTRAAMRAAFIKSDGTVVDLDGTSAVTFSSIAVGDYYIVVHHRNHLSVMSANPVSLSGSSALYDFTVGGKAYGTNPVVNLSGNVYGMYAGDSDRNAVVSVLDYNAVGSQIFRSGYLQGDHDMNGIITVLDYNLVGLNIFKSSRVP